MKKLVMALSALVCFVFFGANVSLAQGYGTGQYFVYNISGSQHNCLVGNGAHVNFVPDVNLTTGRASVSAELLQPGAHSISENDITYFEAYVNVYSPDTPDYPLDFYDSYYNYKIDPWDGYVISGDAAIPSNVSKIEFYYSIYIKNDPCDFGDDEYEDYLIVWYPDLYQ